MAITLPRMDLGTFINEKIKRRGITQRRYASSVKAISASMVLRIICGIRLPPLNKLDALMKPLRLEPDEVAEFRYLAGAAHIGEELLRAEFIAVFYREREHKATLDRLNALIDHERLGG